MRKYENDLNFKGIDFPIKAKDIQKFEKQNPDLPGINVFSVNENNKIYPLRINEKYCRKRFPCKKPTGILAGSHRDSRRVLPRFWPPGFPFPAGIHSGILAGLPPGSRRDFGRRDFASGRERWRDRPPRFWPLSFRSPP